MFSVGIKDECGKSCKILLYLKKKYLKMEIIDFLNINESLFFFFFDNEYFLLL